MNSFKKIIFLSIVSAVLAACSSVSQTAAGELNDIDLSKKAADRAVAFEEWKIHFREKLEQKGFSESQIDALLTRAVYHESTIKKDKSQPEFSKMPWEYIDSAVSESRVRLGKKAYAENQELLDELSKKYQSPASIIVAVWGMESGYGSFTGKADLVSALATLAYDGRRETFAENQLIAILQLIDEGDITWPELKGSWAGGMGHTQFIPTTFIAYGIDGNNDGKRDPWNKADALASTANYLHHSKWSPNFKWGYEVSLPQAFDYDYLHRSMSIEDWGKAGVKTVNHATNFDKNTAASLWLPAGSEGPAFLLTSNFDVIKTYNNSSSYALAIGLLSDMIDGKREAITKGWPREMQPLTSQEIKALQQDLTNLDFDTRGADGILGANTKKAFGRWQKENGQTPDEFINRKSAAPLIAQ